MPIDTPSLRIATAADVAALHRLVEGAYRGDSARRGWTHEADLLDGQRTDPQVLADMIADPHQRVLLTEVNGALIGCVGVRFEPPAIGYLGMLSVDPAHQAAGTGRQLIAAAEALARDIFGATVMEMTVIRQRGDLIAYYERRGYRLTGETRAFPLDDPSFGIPRTRDLVFVVLAKPLA
ncbi:MULTISPECIES: GNAT family N-acetyltransferase [unclassified Sphingomonas]|uniref:GNAT family N-acetyltransferase n=1 Tax=unclassified Sphingomonas TaxID=196159 RepID=UPI0008341837|nr:MULTISPECIES: GNAT family N-acetyltransferase [unclassified Sphingomonas]